MHSAAASIGMVTKFSYLSFGIDVANVFWCVSNLFLAVIYEYNSKKRIKKEYKNKRKREKKRKEEIAWNKKREKKEEYSNY